jgi:DNA-binding response OmpR family regulator
MSDTVLVVEGDEWVRHLLAAALADGGHAVAAAKDVRAALDQIERGRPALVLLDAPYGDAGSFRLALEARPVHPPIPIVLLGPCAEPRGETGLRSCADGYVPEPIDLALVLAEVGRLLATAGIAARHGSHRQAEHDSEGPTPHAGPPCASGVGHVV